MASNSVPGAPAASISGTPSWEQGLVGNALGFHGATTAVVVPSFVPAINCISGSGWVKVPTNTSMTNDANIFRNDAGEPLSFERNVLGQFQLWLLYDSQNAIWYPCASLGTGLGSSWFSQVESRARFPLGDWHHLAFSADRAYLALYMDGVPVARTSYYPRGLEQPIMPQILIGVGDDVWSASLQGQIDELALWRRALRSDEIAALYQAGKSGHPLTSISESPPIPVPPALTIKSVDNGISVTWTYGTLSTAPTVDGPWIDRSWALSPFVEPIGSGPKFYRAHN
jgi:hypothetical protein